MLYDYELAIPANTLRTAPASTEVIVGPGIIHRVEVQFPSGCAGLVNARVKRWGHQLWPTNVDGWLTADGYVIAWDDEVDVSEPPLSVFIEGYNDDDTYQHTLTFRFAVAMRLRAAPTPPPERSPVGMALAAIMGAAQRAVTPPKEVS